MYPTYLLITLVIYSIVFVIGFAGNISVIITLLLIFFDKSITVRAKFKRVSIYVLLLSIVDLMVLSMLPLLVSYFHHGTWQFGYISCKIFWSIENVNKLLSVAILTVMSFERYLGICRPLSHDALRHCNPGFVILFSLLFVSVLCTPIIYYSGTMDHVMRRPNETIIYAKVSCSADLPDNVLPYFICYMFVFAFVIPVIFITLCYVFIIRNVNKSSNRGLLRRQSKVFSTSSKVIRSILWVVVFHFICWTPFWAAVLLTLSNAPTFVGLFVSREVLAMIRLTASFLPYINCAGNWIFYAAFNREIQETSRELRLRHSRRIKNSAVVSQMVRRARSLTTRSARDDALIAKKISSPLGLRLMPEDCCALEREPLVFRMSRRPASDIVMRI